MKNNGNFKNAGSSRAKTWRNILLILGAVALIASYIADIRDPHPGTETQDNRPFVEQALKDGFQTLHARVLVWLTAIPFTLKMTKEKKLELGFLASTLRRANKLTEIKCGTSKTQSEGR